MMLYWLGTGKLGGREGGGYLTSLRVRLNFYYIKVNVPGQMYPVEEFYLEQILTITNFMTDLKGGNSKTCQKFAAADNPQEGLHQLSVQLAQGGPNPAAAGAAAAPESDDVIVESRSASQSIDYDIVGRLASIRIIEPGILIRITCTWIRINMQI